MCWPRHEGCSSQRINVSERCYTVDIVINLMRPDAMQMGICQVRSGSVSYMPSNIYEKNSVKYLA